MAVTEATLINAGVQAGLVEAESIAGLKLLARRERIRLIEAVMRAGRFPEAALYQALADLRGITFLLPKDLRPDPDAMEKLPRNVLLRRAMLPVRRPTAPCASPSTTPTTRRVSRWRSARPVCGSNSAWPRRRHCAPRSGAGRAPTPPGARWKTWSARPMRPDCSTTS
ncbi:MAG: hypothetical protein U5S82_18615 [Gammaproteobacteria bacterium]|nr:hypothetical protein [Gammaproteobacteria bacterium]